MFRASDGALFFRQHFAQRYVVADDAGDLDHVLTDSVELVAEGRRLAVVELTGDLRARTPKICRKFPTALCGISGIGKWGESGTPAICGNFPTAWHGGLRIGRLGIWWQHRRMADPRSQLISDEEPGFFHA